MEKIRNPVSIEFLRTEVETSLGFARIASRAETADKKVRNRHYARRGYDTLLHFANRLALNDDERTELQVGILELRRQLIALGEEL